MSQRGRPRGWRAPDPRCVMVSVRLTATEAAALDACAVSTRGDRSATLRAALFHYLRYARRAAGRHLTGGRR